MQIITIQAAHLPNRSIPEKKVKADRKILHFLGKMALLKKKKALLPRDFCPLAMFGSV